MIRRMMRNNEDNNGAEVFYDGITEIKKEK